MPQTKEQRADTPQNESPPHHYFTIELIRRPNEDGSFGTVSYKVSASGDTMDGVLNLVDELSTQLESQYGESKHNRR